VRVKLIINKLFAFSDRNNKYFYAEFDDDVNIIHGKNTSGKSTIFQSIMYTLGINDSNEYLKEILEEDVFFRLDCKIKRDITDEKVTFIREHETIFIKREKRPVLRFSGINGDNSVEHIKLKEYMHELFGFSLKLEGKSGYKPAPIETMFLPYYISQSVGWVYLRKSFGSLEFYRNFKEDYLDYYVGIESSIDRDKKTELEKRLKCKNEEIEFYISLEKSNNDFQLTKLVDEQFTKESKAYIDSHAISQVELSEWEQEYISKCNKLSYYQERLSLLRKISKNHKEQNPGSGICPACQQKLPFSIAATYKFLQEENDTDSEKRRCKENIKKLQSEINSLSKNIGNRKLNISKEYEILRRYFNHDISFDSWMKSKVDTQLITNIKYKLGELATDKMMIEENLKGFKTEEEVQKARVAKNWEFSTIFLEYLSKLGVKSLKEERYKLLYKISAFPSQGVELHKTVLAYNFAFNKLISKTEDIHRFPFLLDAIFKEDIEQSNRNAIVEFIGKYRPNDTQLILSIAETKQNEKAISEYDKNYFNGKAKFISVGDGIKERAFLDSYHGTLDSYLEETLNIIEG